MNYTHYGNAGIPFALVKEYKNYDEMVSSFKLGPGYLDVRYGEYVIISSEDLDHGGEIYRREYNFKNNMGGAKFITNMNQGQREWAEEAKKQAERAQQAADSAEEITEIAYGLAETIINNELERIEAEQQRVEDFQEMEEIFTDLQGIQVSEEEPTSEKVGAWIKEGTEEDRFLLENTDIAQKLGQDKNKVTSQKLVNDTIELIDAKIENIEAELAVNSIVDADFAQEKVVPENILPQVQVNEIGGMSYKCNNLIPFPYKSDSVVESSGITWTVNTDRGITANGTKTGSDNSTFTLLPRTKLPIGTYNLSGLKATGGYSSFHLAADIYNNDGSWSNIYYDLGYGCAFNVTEGQSVHIFIRIQGSYNETVNFTVYPMLNAGNIALPYEPYFTGLRDSKVTEIESVGVNLIPFPYASPTTTMNGVTWTVNDDDSITASGTATGYSYFTLSDNVPISKKEIRVSPNGVNLSNVRMIFRLLDANKNALFEKNVYNFEKINIADYPMATAFSSFLVRDNHVATTGTFLPMINYGAKGLAYSRGFRNTFEIPAAVQNLEGYGQGINEEYYNKIVIDKDGKKKFIKNIGCIDMGTMNWTYSTTGNTRFDSVSISSLIKTYRLDEKADILCSSYITGTAHDVYSGNAEICSIEGGIWIYDTNYNGDVAAFKTAMSGKILYYALAEPIEIDITDLFPESNFLGAESGGTITAINEYEYDVPFTVEYKEKKNILSAEEIEEKLESKVDKTNIAQELGDSAEKVLSQKAAARELRKIVAVKYAKTGWYVKSITHHLTYDGLLMETDGVYCLNVPVNAGETYLVETGQISASMALWAVFDVGENIIAQDTTKYVGIQSANANVTIPDGGAMLRVYGYYNQNISCKKEVTIIPSPLTDKKWVAYGDSLTDPATLKEFKNYVDFVTLETACIPINLGKGGSGFLKNQKYYGRVSAIPEDTDVITVFGSFNDYSFIADGNLGTADDDGSVETPTTLGAAMNKFLLELYARCPYVKIGFISPICWTWNNPYGGDRKENSEAYVALLEAVAKKWSIPYLDLFHTANVRLWDSETSKKYTINNDGTHLTEEGHKAFIYKKVKNFLETIC